MPQLMDRSCSVCRHGAYPDQVLSDHKPPIRSVKSQPGKVRNPGNASLIACLKGFLQRIDLRWSGDVEVLWNLTQWLRLSLKFKRDLYFCPVIFNLPVLDLNIQL